MINKVVNRAEETLAHHGQSLFAINNKTDNAAKKLDDLSQDMTQLSTVIDRMQSEFLLVKGKVNQISPIKIQENYGKVLELDKRMSASEKMHKATYDILRKKTKDGGP